jgi:hypothetical protein
VRNGGRTACSFQGLWSEAFVNYLKALGYADILLEKQGNTANLILEDYSAEIKNYCQGSKTSNFVPYVNER